MGELEEEIMESISNLKIQEKVKVITGEEKKNILLELQKTFVNGNPRVWWLSLKYEPTFLVFKQEKPYKEIVNFFDKEEDVWFVIENDDQILLKTKISHVIDIIGDCIYFEYNIISKNYDRFLCETDHGDFLFIDIHKNKSKEFTNDEKIDSSQS